MKILIADKYEAAGVDQLAGVADEVRCEPSLKGDSLASRLAEFDPTVLVVRSTKVAAEAMARSPRLELIVRAGAGFDNIDTAGASERGIRVANCPGKNSVAVAELVMGLMIALDRRIPDNVADLRAGKWAKKKYSKARGLKGRTLGIIGAGRIGSEVAKRALAFDMHVLFFDILPDARPADHPDCKRAEIDQILREADYVTLHVPGTGDTRHLIDSESLAKMKSTAALINTSRPGVVDEPALARALKEGSIRAAALDVYADEPGPDAKTFDAAIADLPNLYGTHHIGASTEQAQLAVAEEVLRIVSEYKSSGEVLNCVNA